MKLLLRYGSAFFLLMALIPIPAFAATGFQVSGWLPYWRIASSTTDAMAHLSDFTEINPFGFVVQNDGTIADPGNISATQGPWTTLIAAAKAKKVRVVPTVMWSNGPAIQNILSNTSSRIALETTIANLVKTNGYSGIEIDFENKEAETKNYFSTFLEGLYLRMGNKLVECDIEPRTPVSSRYDGTPPADATEYANNYVAINKYCDVIKIMAYDQGTIDLKLNAAADGAPYIPVADPQWVYKVLELALQTISPKKIMLGVATYGYEYQVTPLSQSGYRYDLLWAFDPQYALDVAAQYGTTIQRNRAAELSFTYFPSVLSGATSTSPYIDTEDSNLGTLATTSYSDGSSGPVSGVSSFNILWWSDATAIEDKVDIAKELGLRGVSIFKVDGGEDPGIWNLKGI